MIACRLDLCSTSLVLFQIIAYLAIDAELMASAMWNEVKVLTSIKARN